MGPPRPLVEDSQYLLLAARDPERRLGILRTWWGRQVLELEGYAHDERRLREAEEHDGLHHFVRQQRERFDAKATAEPMARVSKSPVARAQQLGDAEDELHWNWSTFVGHSTVASLHLHTHNLHWTDPQFGLHDATPLHIHLVAAATVRYVARIALSVAEILQWSTDEIDVVVRDCEAEMVRLYELLHPMGRWGWDSRPIPRRGPAPPWESQGG